MSGFTEVQFKYVGSFRVNNRKYEVIEDIHGELINIFYKSEKDVECYTVLKHHIDKYKGKNLLDKTKNHWRRLMTTSQSLLDFIGITPQLQVFDIGFWDDVLTPLKNGENENFTIKRKM